MSKTQLSAVLTAAVVGVLYAAAAYVDDGRVRQVVLAGTCTSAFGHMHFLCRWASCVTATLFTVHARAQE